MIHLIKANNFNTLFANSIYQISKNGKLTNPRNFNCREIISPILELTNPLNCLITIKERKLNYAYLIIEKFMYLSGFCDPTILISYNRRMSNYLNENGKFDGAYGPRIKDQLYWCYELLKKDHDTRQAVITIHNSSDNHETKDNPCTLTLHFLLRENHLNLIVNMRSNDIKWGTCLDIPAFCFIQEVMSCWLGVELGSYIHHPASLHYYLEFEEELLNYCFFDDDLFEIVISGTSNFEVNPSWSVNFNDTQTALQLFWDREVKIRNREKNIKPTGFEVIDAYLSRLEKYWRSK
jgi:thymidylate synthase